LVGEGFDAMGLYGKEQKGGWNGVALVGGAETGSSPPLKNTWAKIEKAGP
jgi:hypothetical protein